MLGKKTPERTFRFTVEGLNRPEHGLTHRGHKEHVQRQQDNQQNGNPNGNPSCGFVN